MKAYKTLTHEQLIEEKSKVLNKYESYKKQKLDLNMARGKPDFNQVSLSKSILDILSSDYDFSQHPDYYNYGILDGITECKQLFADILDIPKENIIVYGNSSLNIMFDQISRGYTHGYCNELPWCKQDKLKWLCPVPGYDRHFAITEHFGFELIPIPMNENGPDMDVVEHYVQTDPSVKGIWCVPQYSNPSGITYSDETVKRFTLLKPAAKDFRIFWDNAYIVHHLYDEQDHVLNIFKDNLENDFIFEFTSTSKVTIPGAGVAALATSLNNKQDILKHMTIQTIGYDKTNQLRHALLFKNKEDLSLHMKNQAKVLRPKFDLVLNILDKELSDLDIAAWNNPKGGYFIAFETLNHCAKQVITLCREAGVILTDAGATFPYGKDPHDKYIRIAPSFPKLEDLEVATELFITCVKLASLEQLLNK